MMLYKVTSVAFDPDSRTAFYTDENYAYRDLIAVDVDTGKKRRLLKDARIGDLAFDRADKSLWGVRHQNGFVTLVRIPPPYTSFNQIKTFRYGEILFDLDVSPDGELISASYGTVDGKQSVRVWKRADLLAGEFRKPRREPLARISITENFTFTPDGKSLLGNSYYTGVSNIVRLDVISGKYDVLTNAATGFFRPQLRPDGSLFLYDYTGEGFNPSIVRPEVRQDLANIRFLGTEVVNARPELKQWGVGSPAKVPLDELITARGMYDPFKRMRFDAHYPIISGYNQVPAFGYYFHIADPLQFRQFSASLTVSPFVKVEGGEKLHVNVEYQTPSWKLTYWHNLADVYDLAGPVLRGRKGNAFIASYTRPSSTIHRGSLTSSDRPRPISACRTCRMRRMSRARARFSRARSASNIPTPPSRLAASTMKRASKAASSPRPTTPRVSSSPSFTAASASAQRFRGAIARPGFTRTPASAADRASVRWPLIISALSATITSMTDPRSGTANWKASPASTSTRLPRASSAG